MSVLLVSDFGNAMARAHAATVNTSEGVRQVAVAAAGSNQAAARTAEILHYRTCLASAIANNCSSETFRSALRSLFAGGV
jgi:hypothetical protein